MALNDDLTAEVKKIFRTSWADRDGEKVPEAEKLTLGNTAVKLNATVLYADLAESTNLVDTKAKQFSAEIYKTFLHCASKIIEGEGGSITAFDGDRVMGVFIGDSKNSSAAKTALKINHAVTQIINPAIKDQYPLEDYSVQHAVGIDTSDLYIARTGVRGSNDLVWVGKAANYAAKLCALRSGFYASYITSEVYSKLNGGAKYSNGTSMGTSMWEGFFWAEKFVTVYRSSWRMRP